MSAPIPTLGGTSVASRIAEIRQRFEPVRPSTTATATLDSAGTFAELVASIGAEGGLEGASSALGTPAPTGGAGGTIGETAVSKAMEYQGIPYLWGGTDPAVGLDCSGFVQHVYRSLGIDLPRVSRDQAKAGTPVASLAEARPGDLIAFGTPVDHIAIYVGDGKIIHAPRTGEVIKVGDIHRTPTAIRRLEPAGASAGASFGSSPLGATPLGGSPLGSLGSTGSAILRDPAVARYAPLFAQAGAKYGLDPSVLAAVAKVESGGNPNASSPAGARGLMQFMPATARGYGIDPLDPAQAIDAAARMLTEQKSSLGTLELALAAYNAGPGAVRRHGGIPPYPETRNYVRKVMSHLVSAS